MSATPSHRALLARLRQLALTSLKHWALEDATLKLVNHGENTVFHVRHHGRSWMLRLHRPDYQTTQAIHAELAWLNELNTLDALRTPRPVPTLDGELLIEVHDPKITFMRRAVLFERLPGRILGRTLGVTAMRTLGQLTARLHVHARTQQPDPMRARAVLDLTGLIGPHAFFGDAFACPVIQPEQRTVLEAARTFAAEKMTATPQTSATFGLVHADLHPWNILRGEPWAIIDFDDCAHSYWMLDFVTTMQYVRQRKNAAILRDAYLEGYASITAIPPHTPAIVPALAVCSQMTSIAWVHSRADLPGMRKHLPRVIQRSVSRCQHILDGADPLVGPPETAP